MNEQTKTQVTNKWLGDLAVIYSIKNLEDVLLPEVLLFYSNENDPNFNYQQEKTIEQIENTRPYKMILFESWDDIPNDMAMSFFFKQ
jgi:hypothetical protein